MHQICGPPTFYPTRYQFICVRRDLDPPTSDDVVKNEFAMGIGPEIEQNKLRDSTEVNNKASGVIKIWFQQ